VTGGATIDQVTDPAPTGHVLRAATVEDLARCAAIWREGLNGYLVPLAQPEVPDDLGAILRLYGHLLSTDPATFLVAERDGMVDGFVVVLQRERLTFLSMLFVAPGAQGRGLGRALLARALATAARTPETCHATATDSAQPISNALYGSLGMVPRMPLLRLVGLPDRPGAFPDLPPGVDAVSFAEIGDGADGLERSALRAELASLDRDTAGFDRTADHAFHRAEGRLGFLLRDRDGRSVGYGYSSEAGRVGPMAVRDSSLLAPLVGLLVTEVRPRGAFGLWVPGDAGDAVVSLLQAGFRLEGFPVLVCWDRPFADFARYIPASPGLL
jgi:ribosomal protein S18 acetylase RimI-like enzyme